MERFSGDTLGDDEFRRLLEACGGNDEDVIFFDDVSDIARHFHDSYDADLDYQILEAFQRKGRLLKRELKAVGLRFSIFLIAMALQICFYLMTFVVDSYLIAQSMYGPNALVDKLRQYREAIKEVLRSIHLPQPWPLSLGFDIMGLLAIDFNIKGGVSCTGMQAPVYLALNYMVVGMIVVLFDTAVFQVLRVFAEDYQHGRPLVLHKIKGIKISTINALRIEGSIIKSTFGNLSRNVRTICQILIAKTDFRSFSPYWQDLSEPCEQTYRGSETAAQYGASFVFWIIFPVCLHLLLHSFCYGIGPPDIDSEYLVAVDRAKRDARDPQHGKA